MAWSDDLVCPLNNAVFIDRDGVVNAESGHVTRENDFHLLPDAASAIRRLRLAGFQVVVITNQSGIARGLLTEAGLDRIHDQMKRQLAEGGAVLDAIYYCPHHPTEGTSSRFRKVCQCRKPAPGLLMQAGRELDISLTDSYMVGDHETDIEAGRAAGCRTILINAEDATATKVDSDADHVCTRLEKAVAWILERER